MGQGLPYYMRSRMGQGHCRPHDRVVPGGAGSLVNVASDMPPAGAKHLPPPEENLSLLLRPRCEIPPSRRAYVAEPVPLMHQARRLRGPPATPVQQVMAHPAALEALRPMIEKHRSPRSDSSQTSKSAVMSMVDQLPFARMDRLLAEAHGAGSVTMRPKPAHRVPNSVDFSPHSVVPGQR